MTAAKKIPAEAGILLEVPIPPNITVISGRQDIANFSIKLDSTAVLVICRRHFLRSVFYIAIRKYDRARFAEIERDGEIKHGERQD